MRSAIVKRYGDPPYNHNNINQYSETETTRRLIPYFRKAFSEQLIPIMREELRNKTAQIQINSGLFSDHDGNVTLGIVSALRRAKFRVIGCQVNDWCSLSGYQGVVNVWVQPPNNFPDEAEKSTRRRNRLNVNEPDIAYLRTTLAEHMREKANGAMRDLTGNHIVLGVGESRTYLPANKGGRQENAARRRNDESLAPWKIWNLTISKANSDVEISFRKTAEKIEERIIDWIRNGSVSILENMASIIPHRDRLRLLDEYEKARTQTGQGFRLLTTPAEMESRREFEEAFVRMRKEFKPWLTSKLAKKHWTDVYMEEKKESRKRRQEAKALDHQGQSVNKKPSSTAPLDLSKSGEVPPYGAGTGSQSNTAPVQSTEEVLLNSYQESWEDDGQSDLLRSIHEDIQVSKERLIEHMEEGNSTVVNIRSPEHEYDPEEPVVETLEEFGIFTSMEGRSGNMRAGDHSHHVRFEVPEEENQRPVMEANLFTPENEENQCPFDASSEAVLSTSVDRQREMNISHPDPTNFGSVEDLVSSNPSGPANLRNIPRDLVFPSPASPVLSVKTQTEDLGTVHGPRDGKRFYASGPFTPDQQQQENTPILIGKPEKTDINSNTMPPCKEGNPERLMKCLRV